MRKKLTQILKSYEKNMECIVNQAEMQKLMDRLIASIGKLSKQYLINSDYKKKEFTPDSHWTNALEQVLSQTIELIEISGDTFSISLERALKKYAKRKRVEENKVPRRQNFSSETTFKQEARQFSYELYGKATVETDLLDLVSEFCELYEEWQECKPSVLTSNWFDELGDIAYLLLRLKK